MRRSESIRFFDFTGGLNTKSPVTALAYNQALDLQNINLLPSGGFEKRRGNSAFNSSAMESGAALHGIGYYRQADADEFLVCIVGTKIYTSPMSGTMTDRTAALTITTGANNLWTSFVMNDNIHFVGGAPNAPIVWNGTGNASALGGSPPSGSFGLTHNRRAFIGNTTSNPSRIAWSILGSPADWTGAGSGTQDIQEGDGDTLVTAIPLNVNHLVCFKQNSIHDLITTTAPFPTFPLFNNVGCVGKLAAVLADGLIYFITPQARMKATDGIKIYEFSDAIDDVWDGLNQSRIQYISGIYNKRLQQIWWFCSNGSATTNNYCIVWDIKKQAWLRHTTGVTMNVATRTQAGTIYGGAYDGKAYQMDVASTYTDASEATPSAISAFWRSGWYDLEKMIESKFFRYVYLSIVSQTTGTFEFGYGFDFVSDRSFVPISMLAAGSLWNQFQWDMGTWGGQTDVIRLSFVKGKGNYFQFLLRNKNAAEAFQFNGMQIPIKIGASQAFKSG